MTTKRLSLVDRDNVALGEAVYRALCRALEDGGYASGDRLREDEVAQRLEVSRTPVREAFGRLMAKGWIQSGGGRGLVVRSLAEGEVLELYAMREILEGAAAKLAAQYATPAEVDAMRDVHARSAAKSSPKDLARLNRHLHGLIQAAARNRYLDVALEDMHVAIGLLGSTTYSVAGRAASATAEHQTLIEAIGSRDPDAAETVARAHIRGSLRARLAMRRSPS